MNTAQQSKPKVKKFYINIEYTHKLFFNAIKLTGKVIMRNELLKLSENVFISLHARVCVDKRKIILIR